MRLALVMNLRSLSGISRRTELDAEPHKPCVRVSQILPQAKFMYMVCSYLSGIISKRYETHRIIEVSTVSERCSCSLIYTVWFKPAVLVLNPFNKSEAQGDRFNCGFHTPGNHKQEGVSWLPMYAHCIFSVSLGPQSCPPKWPRRFLPTLHELHS